MKDNNKMFNELKFSFETKEKAERFFNILADYYKCTVRERQHSKIRSSYFFIYEFDLNKSYEAVYSLFDNEIYLEFVPNNSNSIIRAMNLIKNMAILSDTFLRTADVFNKVSEVNIGWFENDAEIMSRYFGLDD